MWLLNVRNMKLEYFTSERSVQVPYAILSHTWDEEELTFDEMVRNHSSIKSKKGYVKVDLTCKQAMQDDLNYCWIDTICIDKTSSTELSEAINSMFRWYRSAMVCYCYLTDVVKECPCLDDVPFSRSDLTSGRGWIAHFASSRWHTRSWTLQELIAPTTVRFYGSEWNYLGSKGRRVVQGGMWSVKKYLRPLLSSITGIDQLVLDDGDELCAISTATKLMWASRRSSSRIEDQAYSLLGIFDINMPLLYGESHNAFLRLQQEIARTSNDLSLLAWLPKISPSERLLAKFPVYFSKVGNIVPVTTLIARETLDVTYNGMRVNVPMLRRVSDDGTHITWIILNCRYVDDLTGPMAARITFRNPRLNLPDAKFDHFEYYEASLTLWHHSRLEVIDLEECANARMQCLLLTQDLPRNPDQNTCIVGMPSFWFRMPSTPLPGFRIIDTDSDLNWNHETGVLCPPFRDTVDSYLTIGTPWETQLYFVFRFISTPDFWARQRAVHKLDWGFQMTLDAMEQDKLLGSNLSLSMPPEIERDQTGSMLLQNGEFLFIALDRQEVMGTLVLTIRLEVRKEDSRSDSDSMSSRSTAVTARGRPRPKPEFNTVALQAQRFDLRGRRTN